MIWIEHVNTSIFQFNSRNILFVRIARIQYFWQSWAKWINFSNCSEISFFHKKLLKNAAFHEKKDEYLKIADYSYIISNLLSKIEPCEFLVYLWNVFIITENLKDINEILYSWKIHHIGGKLFTTNYFFFI